MTSVHGLDDAFTPDKCFHVIKFGWLIKQHNEMVCRGAEWMDSLTQLMTKDDYDNDDDVIHTLTAKTASWPHAILLPEPRHTENRLVLCHARQDPTCLRVAGSQASARDHGGGAVRPAVPSGYVPVPWISMRP